MRCSAPRWQFLAGQPPERGGSVSVGDQADALFRGRILDAVQRQLSKIHASPAASTTFLTAVEAHLRPRDLRDVHARSQR